MNFYQSDCEKAIKASLKTYEFEKMAVAAEDEELMLQIAAFQEFEKKVDEIRKKNEMLRQQAKKDEELMLQIAAIQEFEKKAVAAKDEELMMVLSLSLYR